MELSSYINPSVLERRRELHHAFIEAQPFRHVVIEGFFQPAFCAALLKQFPAFDEKGAINEDGAVGGKSTQERVRSLGRPYEQLDDLVQRAEFLQLIGTVTGIDDLRYDPYYFGGGTHENRHGQDLDPHVDFNYHPVTHQHRRLNLIVYLNEEWDTRWGGALQLHRDPYRPPKEDEIKTIAPLLNCCVIFETNEHSWHGFERINLPGHMQKLSRKSFALYYYTDTRPARETAEEHSTVYVERHLPERFHEGLTLGDGDVHEIRTMLARRDQHLKRLYKNIHRLYGEVNRQKNSSPSAARASQGQTDSPVANPGEASHVIHALRARVHELENSTSWRLTAPLRAVKRWISGKG